MIKILVVFLLALSTNLYSVPNSVPKVLPMAPIVYHPAYNINMFPGQSYIHPFDSQKYGKVFRHITSALGIHPEQCYAPKEITPQELATVHSTDYLSSLQQSSTVAKITEIAPLAYVPSGIIDRKILKPMRFATQGTILAAELALSHRWAINLSGGYHHAKATSGEGFCVYADIPLAINTLITKHSDKVKKILVVDLDAHQGNGFESIVARNRQVETFDMYNNNRYPTHDRHLPITYRNPMEEGCSTEEYLAVLKRELPKAIAESKPDFIIYNAGTDILSGDRVGGMNVSAEGIIQRDEFVFEQAVKNNTPITMVLSGGYTDKSAEVISKSIVNVKEKFFNDEINAVAKDAPPQTLFYRHPGLAIVVATALTCGVLWAGYHYLHSNKDIHGNRLLNAAGKAQPRSMKIMFERMNYQQKKAREWVGKNKLKATIAGAGILLALREIGYKLSGRKDSPLKQLLGLY